MKIGIFDSGVGGLLIMRAIVKKLPQYDYHYLGDTKHMPYGNRTQAEIYELTKQAVDYLFKQGCHLIILACNSASSQAVRRIQRDYLPKHYPSRRVLGVIIPTVEAALGNQPRRIGVLATQATVASGTYPKEFKKLAPRLKVYQQAAPLLAPLVEYNELTVAKPIIAHYLAPLLKQRIDTVVLGCTHYSRVSHSIKKLMKGVRIIDQTAIIPAKLQNYLLRHPEIESKLSRRRRRYFHITENSSALASLADQWFGKHIKLQKISY
jgi:glutamate racemase